MAEPRKKAPSRKASGKTVPHRTNRKTGSVRKPSLAKKTPEKTSRRSPKKTARKASARPSATRWSQRVSQESDALDLKRGVFTLTDPKKIAASLKRSAQHSARRKTGAYRSALSMLTFYINRAGRTLPKAQRDRLQRAKVELKHQFGKD